jgi:hypothetical protein
MTKINPENMMPSKAVKIQLLSMLRYWEELPALKAA